MAVFQPLPLIRPPTTLILPSPPGFNLKRGLQLVSQSETPVVLLGSEQQQKRPRCDDSIRSAGGGESSARSTPTSEVNSDPSSSPKTKSARGSASEEENGGQLCGLGGEQRLVISFQRMGSLGSEPQIFGKSGYYIPDGICGKHRMYSQDWMFEIHHRLVPVADHEYTVLEWSITNLTSGTRVIQLETPQEAMVRTKTGNTICNTVLRSALDSRIKELEEELKTPGRTPLQIANVKSLMKELCPRKCAQGLLFFGLRHLSVQKAVGNKRVLEAVEASSKSPEEQDKRID